MSYHQKSEREIMEAQVAECIRQIRGFRVVAHSDEQSTAELVAQGYPVAAIREALAWLAHEKATQA